MLVGTQAGKSIQWGSAIKEVHMVCHNGNATRPLFIPVCNAKRCQTVPHHPKQINLRTGPAGGLFFNFFSGPLMHVIFREKYPDSQRALRDISMPRGKNRLPTVSRHSLKYPRLNCLLTCLPNLSILGGGFNSSLIIGPAARVIAQ